MCVCKDVGSLNEPCWWRDDRLGGRTRWAGSRVNQLWTISIAYSGSTAEVAGGHPQTLPVQLQYVYRPLSVHSAAQVPSCTGVEKSTGFGGNLDRLSVELA